MPRPKLPAEKAHVTGAAAKNPARYAPAGGRNAPVVDEALGDPPDWLTDTDKNLARSAWFELATTVPWLNHSHRIMVAGAASILGRLMAGQELGVHATNLIRLYLSQMGATPTDAGKVARPAEGDKDDPAEEFFA